MLVKIFYMNDEPHRVTVKVMDESFDHVTGTGEIITHLQPAEGRAFELNIPDGAILYVKKWDKMVLISYVYQPVPVRPGGDLLYWGSL